MHVQSVLVAAATATLPFRASAQGASGNGRTTRYWDCCKPSCGWGLKTNSGKYVQTCDKSDGPLRGSDTKSGCDNGVASGAYMCSDQSPWAVNETTAYGWAAVKLAGSNEQTWCCACYELTFTSGAVKGKTMVVQASNTGGDLGQNHFDIAVSANSSGSTGIAAAIILVSLYRPLRVLFHVKPRLPLTFSPSKGTKMISVVFDNSPFSFSNFAT